MFSACDKILLYSLIFFVYNVVRVFGRIVHLNCDLSQSLWSQCTWLNATKVAVLLLIKMASNCNLRLHYMDCDFGRSTLSKCCFIKCYFWIKSFFEFK